MSKKLFSFFCISLILAFTIFCLMPDFYTPDNTLPQTIAKTNRIIIDGEIIMEKTNGIWNSPENEGYPLDNDAIIKMLEHFEKASVYAKKYNSANKGNFKIVLQNENNEKTELYFHKNGQEINGTIAVINKQTYHFSDKLSIPAQPYQWFSQPLFPFENREITKISGIEKDKFDFADLLFFQATRQNEFSDWPSKQIDITLENGIVLKLTLYTQNGSYWLSAQMKNTIMPTKDAKEYTNNNKELYEGWFFEIPQPIGNELF
ncbi:MAG: hypothetical protein J6T72_04095 [Alphaproteobacteria bacterium]|nr:hypothetical protein [Alphaproteobacteria bacterium]